MWPSPLRPELVRLWPVLRVAVQHEGWDQHHHSLWNGHSIELHSLLGDPLEPAPDGVEPDGFVHHHIQVLHLNDGAVRGSGLGEERED